MALKRRYKPDPTFSMSSMTDIVFLLLIFFMVTSTLIAPNAIKLLLPQSSSKTIARQSVVVYINQEEEYLMDVNKSGNAVKLSEEDLLQQLMQDLATDAEGSVVLRADRTVSVQAIVKVFDIVEKINKSIDATYKVILATQTKDK